MKPPNGMYHTEAMIYLHADRLYHVLCLVCNRFLKCGGIFHYHMWHSFCHHIKMSDITFYYHNLIFTGTIQVYGRGILFSFKPSAFESEIHPLHKLRLCNGDFALAGGISHASVT